MAELTAELTKELEKLRKALQSGKNDIVPFVGAGLSSPPLPGWREILEEVSAMAPEEAQAAARSSLAEGKLRDAAAALDDAQNRANVERTLAANFANPQEPRPETFRALAALPVQQLVTTARDPWLKAALGEKLGAVPRLYVPTDANALLDLTPQSGPLVVMLHGDADRPETCVLSEAGYKALGKAPRSYAAALKGLVGSRKILFVGCSPKEPDVAALLDGWAELFGADEASGVAAPRHFFLGAGLTEDEKALLFKLRIRPIEIGAAGDGAALGQALAFLAGTPAPSAPGLETTRTSPRPAPAARTEAPAAAAAPTAAKEKYDPLARVKAAELETVLKAREADVKRLEDELAAARAAAEKVAALEAEVERLTAHDAEAKRLEEEIARGFEKRDAEARALEAEVASLRSELEARKGELAATQAELAAKDAELAGKHAELEGKHAELASRSQDARSSSDLAARAQNLEATVAQLEQLRHDLEDARLVLEGEKQGLELKAAEAQALYKERDAEVKKLQAERAALVRPLEEKVAALEKARAALEADAKKLKESSQTEVARARAEADAARKKVEAELAATKASLAAEHAKPPASASKVPLVVGILFLLLGLGAAGVAIFHPALLDPVRSAVGGAPK